MCGRESFNTEHNIIKTNKNKATFANSVKSTQAHGITCLLTADKTYFPRSPWKRQERQPSTPRGSRATSIRLVALSELHSFAPPPAPSPKHSAGPSHRSSGQVWCISARILLSIRTVGEMRRLGGGGGDELARQQQQQQQQTPERRIWVCFCNVKER